MNSKTSWKIRLAQILLGAGFLLALVVVRGTHAGNGPIHLTTDWSHRRVVFSAPKNLGQHVKLLSNPRYVQQLVRRNSGNNGNGDPGWKWRRAPEPTPGPTNPIHGDWSAYIGSGGTIGAGRLPAKFSFDENSASCDTNNSSPNTNNNEDFVVYNTGLVPSAAGTDASITGTFSTITPTNGTTVTIANNNLPAPNVLTLYANTGSLATANGTVTVSSGPTAGTDTVTTGPTGNTTVYAFESSLIGAGNRVLVGGSLAATAENLEAAINDNVNLCSLAPAACFANIAAPNALTASLTGTSGVKVTAPVDGAAGTVSLTSSNAGRLPVTGVVSPGSGANDGLNFQVAVSAINSAANLQAAIVRYAGNTTPVNGQPAVGVTSPTTLTATVTLNSTNTGLGGHPGKVDITVVSNVTGFAWTGGNGSHLAGGAAGASIVAYDNVCPGGTGIVPWTYWAYNTGGQAVTSPVLSGDGSQVAFVQNVGGTAQLVLLKWAQWNGTSPPVPPSIDAPITLTTQATAAAYTTCAAPCMYTMAFTTATTDINSDPFYDYAHDTIYVGDDGGNLLKFTNVFKGSPLEVITGGWPVAVTNGGKLTSPVFDDGTGKVLVASSSGYLNAVLATTGADTVSAQAGHTGGIFDSPILDPTNEKVYVIVSDDTNGSGGNSGIFQWAAGFSVNGTAGTETIISATNPGTAIFDGDFDNAYYSGGAGHMYVCGPAAASDAATLYQIAVSSAGVLGAVTPVGGLALSTDTTTFGCSGVTEFFNSSFTNGGANPSGTDLIFLSVNDLAITTSPISCPSATGCLMSFDVTNGAIISGKTTVAQAAVSGGTSGIIVDNDVTTATVGAGGGSQVYFTPLGYGYSHTMTGYLNSDIGIGGCAMQASQSALH